MELASLEVVGSAAQSGSSDWRGSVFTAVVVTFAYFSPAACALVSSQFDEYLPPYLLESSDSGTRFAPCTAASGVSNKEASDLLIRPHGVTGVLPEVCVATNGDGLQCFSLGNS